MPHMPNSGRYFAFDKHGTFFAVPNSRPNNQNGKGVVTKSAARLKGLQIGDLAPTASEFLSGVMNGTQLSKMNKGEGLQMAHVVSIAEIKDTIAAHANIASKLGNSSKDIKTRDAIEEYYQGMITTDAEDADKVGKLARIVAHKMTPAAMKAAAMRRLATRLNRSSGNFAGGGHGVRNASIGSHLDIPSTKHGNVYRWAADRMKVQENDYAAMGSTRPARFKPKLFAGKAFSSTGAL